jgi:hypothetical protein
VRVPSWIEDPTDAKVNEAKVLLVEIASLKDRDSPGPWIMNVELLASMIDWIMNVDHERGLIGVPLSPSPRDRPSLWMELTTARTLVITHHCRSHCHVLRVGTFGLASGALECMSDVLVGVLYREQSTIAASSRRLGWRGVRR